MTNQQVPELSIPELLDQPWIKRFARLMSFVAVLAFGGVTAYFFSLGNRITAIEADRTTRIIKSDATAATLNSNVTDLQLDMDRVRSDVVTVKQDVALMKGILQQMQREDVASHPVPETMEPLGAIPLLMSVQRN
jgi:hypothetical protein